MPPPAMSSFANATWQQLTLALVALLIQPKPDPLPSWTAVRNLAHLSPPLVSYLKLVYATMCVALVASAVGVCIHKCCNVGGCVTMLGCLLLVRRLLALPVNQERERYALLVAAAVLEGATVVPLIEVFTRFDPSPLVTAFVGAILAFGCFSGATIVANHWIFVYLGGLLSFGLSFILWFRFASIIFGPSAVMYKVEAYPLLSIFVYYMIFHTQHIIERADHGELDYVKHALILFADLTPTLVRGLIFLVFDLNSKERERRRLD